VLLKCVAAGKHVFCEKPLTLSAQDTEECLSAAEAKDILIYCGFQRRSDPEFQEARRRLMEQKTHAVSPQGGSDVEILRVSSRDAASHNTMGYLQNSGGYFYDSLIHDFDMAHWLIGHPPIEVFTVGASFIPELKAHGDIDSVAVVLRFGNGEIATIDNNRSAVYGYDQRTEIFGVHGMIQVDNRESTSVVLSDGHGVASDNPLPGMQRYAVAYREEIDHFINVLHGKEEPRVTHHDCLVVHRIADAACKSWKTGQPVELKW